MHDDKCECGIFKDVAVSSAVEESSIGSVVEKEYGAMASGGKHILKEKLILYYLFNFRNCNLNFIHFLKLMQILQPFVL